MLSGVKREGKRITLSTIHRMQALIDKKRVGRELVNFTMDVVTNQPPEKIKRITFVITRMVKFHGGQTSILRLGTELAKLGYDVVYAVYKSQSREEMELCASSNLKDYKGRMCTSKQLPSLKSDVFVASSWDTVSFVKKKNGYRMYFVQDYEPYFYSFGELFLMAKKTYEMGLHMVSLGAWNKEMIEKNCRVVSAVDVIDFPYEKKEYPTVERDYAGYARKKKLVLAVYLKYYGKRLPCVLQYMMKELAECFLADGIALDVRYYGEAKSFHCEGGVNLGMLNKEQLFALYKEADFGVVASMSNISLVPYEMIATGLPVIEFADGTFPYFFPEGSGILTEISGRDLYEKLKCVLQEPERLAQMQRTARGYMDGLSWERSAAQFQEILCSLQK